MSRSSMADEEMAAAPVGLIIHNQTGDELSYVYVLLSATGMCDLIANNALPTGTIEKEYKDGRCILTNLQVVKHITQI